MYLFLGPYHSVKGNISNKSDIFIFQVHKDQCYKLTPTIFPVRIITQFDFEKIVIYYFFLLKLTLNIEEYY